MLKSTHRATAPLPLPEGWTEHKAPTGHTYYYNPATKQSTYTRPVAPPAAALAPVPPAPLDPSQSFLQYQAVGSSVPSAGAAFNHFTPPSQVQGGRGGFQGHIQRTGGGGHDRPRDSRPQPVDKPTSRHPIPRCEPWVLVYTKYGRRFVYNAEKNQSYWRIPDKLKDGILALDQSRIKEKAEALLNDSQVNETSNAPGAAPRPTLSKKETVQEDGGERNDDSSEYEEVEVTDDEAEDVDGEHPQKRQRTEDAVEEPVEFNEDDIAFQLAAMGQEYGLDPGEYDDGNMEWDETAEGMEMTHEDSAALFKDLLNDFGINPYSPWEKLVEEGKLVDDIRYTALPSMKSRREVWEEWSREKIKLLQEHRAREEKKDPRIPYLAFLQKRANPKLYWPEFKRKYKKEPEMRDPSLSDKDRERFYRDHIGRLKLPQSTLKSDFLGLMKSQPSSVLNNMTLISHLPPTVLADIRYISIDPSTRDPLIETYITTLPPPPKSVSEQEDAEAVKEREARERRQIALETRERHVAEQKRRQKRDLDFGKGRLRDEEAEIARAMNVTKRGLKGHLMADDGIEKPA